MFRGLGAGDVLECWFPILPIIRLVVFFGLRAIYQEPLKVLSEANKSSTVKEPACGLLGTWETTDVLNVAGPPPPPTPSQKKAGCVRSDGEASLCWFSERAHGGTLHRQRRFLFPPHSGGKELQRKGRKVVTGHLHVSHSVNWCECETTLSSIVSWSVHFKEWSTILWVWIRTAILSVSPWQREIVVFLHCSCRTQYTHTLYWWLDNRIVVLFCLLPSQQRAGTDDKHLSTAMTAQNIIMAACIFNLHIKKLNNVKKGHMMINYYEHIICVLHYTCYSLRHVTWGSIKAAVPHKLRWARCYSFSKLRCLGAGRSGQYLYFTKGGIGEHKVRVYACCADLLLRTESNAQQE